MNRNGDLTSEEIKALKNWLKLDAKQAHNKCPFGAGDDGEGCEICHKMFPTLEKKQFEDGAVIAYCPCCHYSRSYVLRKARLLLVRKGKFKRGPQKWERDQKRAEAKDETATKV